MKINDVKVGQRYAWTRNSWSPNAIEVEVLEVVRVPRLVAYSVWAPPTERGMIRKVKVRRVDTDEKLVVEARYLLSPWGQFTSQRNKDEVRDRAAHFVVTQLEQVLQLANVKGIVASTGWGVSVQFDVDQADAFVNEFLRVWESPV